MQLPDYDELRREVVKILSACERFAMANQGVDLDDPEMIDMYTAVLAKNGITAGSLKEAKPKILGEEFFPKPGTLLKHALPVQERLEAAERKLELLRMVSCVNDEGQPTMALPERVRNGRLLPEGDLSGDGSAAPALPMREPSPEAIALLRTIRGGDDGTRSGEATQIRTMKERTQ